MRVAGGRGAGGVRVFEALPNVVEFGAAVVGSILARALWAASTACRWGNDREEDDGQGAFFILA